VKLWLDDIRPAPNGWTWCQSVSEAIVTIGIMVIEGGQPFEAASLDHDLGLNATLYQEAADKGLSADDCIMAAENPRGSEFLDWMVENDIWPSTRPTVHSANAYAAQQMRKTIDRYWRK
jgi:hypothetical protein